MKYLPPLTAPTHFPSTPKRAGEVAVRNEIDQGLALFRRGCRVLRFVGRHFKFRILRLCLIAGVGERQYIRASLL